MTGTFIGAKERCKMNKLDHGLGLAEFILYWRVDRDEKNRHMGI